MQLRKIIQKLNGKYLSKSTERSASRRFDDGAGAGGALAAGVENREGIGGGLADEPTRMEGVRKLGVTADAVLARSEGVCGSGGAPVPIAGSSHERRRFMGAERG